MREFIEKMRAAGRLTEVSSPCSTEYEAPKRAAATDDLVLFEDLDGMRGVMNLVATRSALALALDIREESLVSMLAGCRFDGEVAVDGKVTTGHPDLSRIPIMKHYPLDAGRYLTSAIVFSRYGGVQNGSIHRMQMLDKTHLAARLVEGRHTYNLHKAALADGENLPVAITIGTHPAVTFASCTRVPEGKELAYAAELRGGMLPVRECSNGVLVPDAEIVLEGYIGAETAEEGPFVDITGTYDPIRIQPVITITGMQMKRDPIYHGILPGGAEHKMLMGAPYEPKIYTAVSGVTGVKNVVLTSGGCGYLHAVVQIKKRTQGDAKNAIMAAFAAHTSLKHVVVVDEDIDPTSLTEVEYAIATRVRGDEDLMVITGVRGSSLDPCRLADGTNVKVGVDATMVMGREDEFVRARWD
ncbi:UbiD family decarboxylase [Methanosphaerula palustris]|uniref:Anhydromevalonate phosphate decarboxylase n=1 Tax=Methanosphaerula palustris (strain ATCC BAA-1556 / DSM 19958 / E1-9c) TaxID=521011 RepID=B8GKK0_METPE|nr:UbiD family decarboxylase [Methanosphaerula palustris]ACL15883.1 UbiD family decarboxylase [Methanosphaerula palustris E1-9c]